MKTSSYTSVILSALALNVLGNAGADTNNDLKTFATGLGISSTDIDALVSLYGESNVDLSCSLLNHLFPNNTELPDEVAYTTQVAINWSTRAHLTPNCVFSPNSTDATATGVKIASFLNTPFAIRSGGHTPEAGPASISDGILFSLENLNQVQLDTEKKIASIGPGNRWVQVYQKLEQEGFLVVGGRVPSVGVGGLVTGGGLSFFSGTEGFAADTVQNFEVVLGDGRVVNANASENPDLWWALKGGSNNFGIVTRFDMHTIPKPGGLIYGGSLYFLPYQYPGVLKAVAEFQTHGQLADPKAAITTSFVRIPSATTEVVMINIFHQDPTETIPEVLKAFFDLGPVQNSVKIRPLSDFVREVYGVATEARPLRQLFRELSMRVSVEVYQYAVDLLKTTYEPLDNTSGLLVSFTYQPISVAMVDAANSTGGRAMGVSRVPQVWICLGTQWELESDDDLIIGTGKDFLAKVEEKAKELGVSERFTYLNDASVDQEVLESYGEKNLKRMRKIAYKYDEEKVFQKLVVGGYKLE